MHADTPSDAPADPGGDTGHDLPLIDEHRVFVAAPAEAVWHCLTRQFTGPAFGAETYAYLVGADPWKADGDSLSEGVTLPGFRVAEADPGRLARLTGRHRFSRYELLFTLEARDGGTLLSARSRARFPGPHGYVYRQLVIGSGAHRILVARMLRTVRRAAERRAAG